MCDYCLIKNVNGKSEGTHLNPFVASVNMYVESAEKDNILLALSKIVAVKEVYEVAGEYDIVSVISTSCMEEFHKLLHDEILLIKGMKSTVTTIVLKLHTDQCIRHSGKDIYLAESTHKKDDQD
jgi:DNA-binding Lrp family transcriptional regulator